MGPELYPNLLVEGRCTPHRLQFLPAPPGVLSDGPYGLAPDRPWQEGPCGVRAAIM